MLYQDEDFKVLEYDGMVFPAQLFKSEAEMLHRFSNMKHFPYKAGDVFLCCYPKTGTHWAKNLLHCFMYDGKLDDLESCPPCASDFFDVEGDIQREGRRILMSHFLPKCLPMEHFEKGGKTILVFRNPKDTVVSMFHMLQKQKVFGDFTLSWEKLVKYWLEGKIPLCCYFEYYNSWQKELSEKPDLDILIVHYEALIKDSLNEVRRIQKYLGLNHSDERLEAVLKKCSLENLKAEVETGKVKSGLVDNEGKSVIFRKGIIGDWKNQFTVAQNEMFQAIVNEKLKNSIFKYR